MSAAIEVRPDRLRQAAAATRALAARVRSLHGALDAAVTGLDAALADGAARQALAELRARWSGAAEHLTAATADLATALEAAATSYERADQESAAPPVPKEGRHAAPR
jgi:WXG100 family type VII secretion target